MSSTVGHGLWPHERLLAPSKQQVPALRGQLYVPSGDGGSILRQDNPFTIHRIATAWKACFRLALFGTVWAHRGRAYQKLLGPIRPYWNAQGSFGSLFWNIGKPSSCRRACDWLSRMRFRSLPKSNCRDQVHPRASKSP